MWGGLSIVADPWNLIMASAATDGFLSMWQGLSSFRLEREKVGGGGWILLQDSQGGRGGGGGGCVQVQ